MQAVADAVVESAQVLQQAMPYLDSISRDYSTIVALCDKVGEIEGRADGSFDRGRVLRDRTFDQRIKRSSLFPGHYLNQALATHAKFPRASTGQPRST